MQCSSSCRSHQTTEAVAEKVEKLREKMKYEIYKQPD